MVIQQGSAHRGKNIKREKGGDNFYCGLLSFINRKPNLQTLYSITRFGWFFRGVSAALRMLLRQTQRSQGENIKREKGGNKFYFCLLSSFASQIFKCSIRSPGSGAFLGGVSAALRVVKLSKHSAQKREYGEREEKKMDLTSQRIHSNHSQNPFRILPDPHRSIYPCPYTLQRI